VSLDPAELSEAAFVLPRTSEQLDLDRALAQLPRDARLCVVLAYSEGMSHAEISAATGLPLGTVKSHVHRGAQRLRSLLDAYQPRKEHAHAG
jgi:RNA polymerase sigma-70 factor (ECF subfamily)